MIRFSLLTVTFALVLAAVAAGDDAGDKKAAEKLHGTWILVSAERNGKAADDRKGHELTFNGAKFTIKKDGRALYEGTYQVDAAKKPMAIDFKHTGDALKGKTWKGIFAVDSDTLKICDNGPNLDKDRPSDFTAKADSGHIAIVFMRAKP